MQNKDLPKQLKEFRRDRGWSQEELARVVGVSLSTVQRWEKRKKVRPTILARRVLNKLLHNQAGHRSSR